MPLFKKKLYFNTEKRKDKSCDCDVIGHKMTLKYILSKGMYFSCRYGFKLF